MFTHDQINSNRIGESFYRFWKKCKILFRRFVFSTTHVFVFPFCSTLAFLHYLAFRGAHTHGDVQSCLTLFLKDHPHRMRDFLRLSHPEAHVLDDYVDHPANHRLLPAELARRENHAAVALPRALPGVPLYLHEVCAGGWVGGWVSVCLWLRWVCGVG